MFGVVRREILQQTSLLPNFAGSDRAMLAELALLGRFRCANERLFLKRFHADVSWALSQKELKGFLSTDGKPYSRRLRQIKAFFGAPRGKPIGVVSKSMCVMLVAAHSARVVVQHARRGDPRRAAMVTDGGTPHRCARGYPVRMAFRRPQTRCLALHVGRAPGRLPDWSLSICRYAIRQRRWPFYLLFALGALAGVAMWAYSPSLPPEVLRARVRQRQIEVHRYRRRARPRA